MDATLVPGTESLTRMKKRKSRLLSFARPAPDPPLPNKPKLQAGRDKTTRQVAVMSEDDRAAYALFVQTFIDDFPPRNIFERQLVRRLADGNWRLNRLHAIEENIFAWGHSGPYAHMQAEHPQIHHAMIQALTFIDDPQLFSLLSLYERRLTQNLEANLKMLLKLQSLPMPNREQHAQIAESAKTVEIPEIARAAACRDRDGTVPDQAEFVLQNDKKAA